MGERYVLIAVQLASGMVLARLLTPEEIGIYSVSLAVIGIALVLRDFGIGSFLVQEKHLTEAHIRSAFGFSLCIGLFLFLLLYACAPLAGRFYDEARLVETMRLSALNFLVLPFCSISISLLRRDMAFKRLAVVNIVATVVGFAVGATLAAMGFGPNSMAIGAVASNSVTGLLAWFARKERKLLLPSFTEWRTLLKFGLQLSAANVVAAVSVDINDLALGRILGFAPVAMISRAQGLMNLFHRDVMAAIRGVMFPAFAKAHRERESVEERYITAVVSVTAVAWPFYGFAALYAEELIRLMFGPQWGEAARLVPIFCLAGAFSATCNLLLTAVMAVGRVDLVTRTELIVQPIRAAIIVATALVFESLLACALAFLCVFVLITPYLYRVKDRCLPTNYEELRRGLLASAKLAALSLLVPLMVKIIAPTELAVVEIGLLLSLTAAVAVISWLAALFICDHPLKSDPLVQSALVRLRQYRGWPP